MVLLDVIDYIPPGFLAAPASELHQVLAGPTLIHLPGLREPPLFVSILQHGNEDVGLLAIQSLLRRYEGRSLPRALSVFVANVEAARYGVRHLPHQRDFNRVWPGGRDPHTPEAAMMAEVVRTMAERGVFASVDLHNNTGLNPHYACINRLDDRYLQLAVLFGRTVVYFIRPRGVQSMAFAELCPAVTVECGRVGESWGPAHAEEYITACLHLQSVPDHPVRRQDLNLFHTVATVKMPATMTFAFEGEPPAQVRFVEGLEALNFRELTPGTPLATVEPGQGNPLEVWDETGRNVAGEYLAEVDGELRLTRPVMPSMLSTRHDAVRQDCVCYFMERYQPTAAG